MGNALEISRNLGLLKKYSAELISMMEDGSFYRLSFTERFKLVRRVKKFYNKLRGPMSALKLQHVIAAAGVLALNTACFIPVGFAPDLRLGGSDDPGSVGAGAVGFSLIPFFDLRGSNPYGIKPLGDRTMSFDQATETMTRKYTVGVGSAFVDMDGDGDLDLVHAGVYVRYDRQYVYPYTESGSVSMKMTWQENTGTPEEPEFGPDMPFPVDTIPGVGSMTFADTDADGDQDLWMATRYSYNEYGYLYARPSASFFENTGSPEAPAFEFRESYLEYLNYGESAVWSLAMADIDGDGDIDMLLTTGDGDGYGYDTYLLRNTGTPEAPQIFPYTMESMEYTFWTEYAFAFALVDIDRDGDLDVVGYAGRDNYGESYGGFVAFENSGDGLNPAFEGYLDVPYGLYSPYVEYSGTHAVLFPQLVDIDADGDLDVFGFDRDLYIDGSYVEIPPYGYSYEVGGLFFFENVGLEPPIEMR